MGDSMQGGITGARTETASSHSASNIAGFGRIGGAIYELDFHKPSPGMGWTHGGVPLNRGGMAYVLAPLSRMNHVRFTDAGVYSPRPSAAVQSTFNKGREVIFELGWLWKLC